MDSDLVLALGLTLALEWLPHFRPLEGGSEVVTSFSATGRDSGVIASFLLLEEGPVMVALFSATGEGYGASFMANVGGSGVVTSLSPQI